MNDYASQPSRFGKHLAWLGAVLGLHLLVLWALQSGLARVVVKKVSSPIEVTLLADLPPPPPAPPPPPPPPRKPPSIPTPPPPTSMPPVEVKVDAPPSPNAIAAVANTPQPVAPPSPLPVVQAPPAPPTPPPAPPAPPVRTAAVVNAAACEKPEYPSASRRLEEEGTVQLRFLVGMDGKVLQSEVLKSSGYRRLDEAARAGLARCQFKPATVNGQPEQAWATISYAWRLE